MGFFDDRIDLVFYISCICGYGYYPYCDPNTTGMSPEHVYNIAVQRACPKCGGYHWSHNLGGIS